MEVIDKLAAECTIKPPTSPGTWKLKMLGFVDDKRHYINLILQQLKEPLEEAMIKSVNIWNELLTFVGGKLEMKKCGFYQLQWKFDKNEKPYFQENTSIIVLNAKGIKVESTRLQPQDSSPYLGITSQPNGDHSA